MLDLYLKLNCEFTDEEKEACIPVIDRLVEISQEVRQSGLLSIDEVNKTEPNFFLKTGLQLAVDGTEAEELRESMQYLILADARKGAELLSRLIIINGVLDIMAGINPYTTKLNLTAMLGEKYLAKVLK